MEIKRLDTFLAYWRGFHGRTRRVIGCIPPARIEWSYRDGKWTLGDLVRHLALLERWMFVENALGRPSAYRGCGREHADGHEAVLALYDRLHEESVALLAAMPEDRLEARCTTPGGAELAVWKWLRAMLEHEAHHRGQIYLYISQLGVATPPLYGLSAEEVAARGVAAP